MLAIILFLHPSFSAVRNIVTLRHAFAKIVNTGFNFPYLFFNYQSPGADAARRYKFINRWRDTSEYNVAWEQMKWIKNIMDSKKILFLLFVCSTKTLTFIFCLHIAHISLKNLVIKYLFYLYWAILTKIIKGRCKLVLFFMIKINCH